MTDIILDGVNLITPTSWNESYSTIESESTSEAGTSMVEVVRMDILTATASFQVSSRWLHILYELSLKSEMTLTKYDPRTNGTRTRTVRIRDFSAEFVKNSEKLRTTNGLWNVSFTIKEF